MKGYKGKVVWTDKNGVQEKEFTNKDELLKFAATLIHYNVHIEESYPLRQLSKKLKKKLKKLVKNA